MKIATLEKAYLWVSAGVLGACLVAILYGAAATGIHLPGRGERIDPQQVRTTPPFDRPGVHPVGENEYDVVLIGQAWAFFPPEVRVPVGAKLNFITTSADVVHGLHVEGTRVNLMLIPGQVTRYPYVFREPGEYTVICHEYCGIGHHTMYGKVIAE